MNAVFDIRLALSCLCRLFREVVASEFMGRPEPNTDFRIKIGSGKCHKKAEASTKTAFEQNIKQSHIQHPSSNENTTKSHDEIMDKCIAIDR